MGRGLGSVELVYRCPVAVKQAGLSTINLELPYSSAVAVWKSTEQSGNRRKGMLEYDTPQTLSKPIVRGRGTIVRFDTNIPVLFILFLQHLCRLCVITFITIFISSLKYVDMQFPV